MKALRELLDHPARGPRRTSPSVAILSVAARPVLDPDLTLAFDRVRFGCSAEDVRELENEQLHLLELVWEALEAASIPIDELGSRSVGMCMATGIDASPVHRWLGLDGPVDRFSSSPHGVLCALERAVAASGGTTDLELVVAPLDQGIAVFVVGAGPLAAAGARVGRVVACARARSLDVAAARCAELSGVTSPHRVDVRDAGGLIQALSFKEPAELVAEGAGAVVVHMVMDRPSPADKEAPRLLRLSSSSRAGLRELVGQVVLRLQTKTDLRSIAVDASRRAPLERRVAVPTGDLEAVSDRLGAWLAGDRDAAPADKSVGKGLGFVFPPAGSQYANMGGSLYDNEPAFREAVMVCDRLLRHKLPRPLLSLMFPQPGREYPLADPAVASPLNFVLGYALSQLMAARGIRPAHVLGCGVGEIVAGTVAGAIAVEDGLTLAVERGRMLRQAADRGERVVLTASEEQARELIQGIDGLDVVAVPVPHKAIVGGATEAVARLLELPAARKLSAERVGGHPGHTPLMDPFLDAYRDVAAKITARVPSIPWVSTSTGAVVEGVVGADHWVSTLRATMRFAVACEVAYFDGSRTFLELAPRPVMLGSGRRTLGHLPVRWVSALEGPEHDDRTSIDEAIAVLWCRGVELPPEQGARGLGAPLPVTHWDRRAIDAPDEDVQTPLLRPPTLVPDEEDPALQQLVEDVVAGGGDEELSPPIAPPSLLDDMAEAEEPEGEADYPDISTFFGEDPTSADGAPMEPLPVAPLPVDTGFLQEAWEVVETPAAPNTEAATWIVLVDEEGVGDYLLSLLTAAGHVGWRVLESPPYARNDETLFVPEPSAPDAWDEVLDRLGTLSGPVRVVHLWALDHRRHAQAWLALTRLVETFQKADVAAPMYVVTRGLFGEEPSPSAAMLWGVGRRMAVEAPRQWGGCIDLDADEDAEALLAHLLERGAPSEVAFHGAERRSRVLRPVEVQPADSWNTDGAWAVVGPADAETLELIRGLGRVGISKVLLVSAEAPTSEVTMAVLGLHKSGVRCTIVRADVRHADDQITVRERLAREGELSGVVMRVPGSRHGVLSRAGDVGRRQVAILEAVPFVLELARQRMVWLPEDALDHGDTMPWAAVVAPAVVQLTTERGGAVVCGAVDASEVERLFGAVRPGQVLIGRSPA